MSYILDALKRAEVERERGAVPGIHTRTAVSYAEVNDASSLTWVWLVGAAVLVAAGAAAFWWWRTPAPMVTVNAPTPVEITPATETPATLAALPPTQPLSRVAPAAVVNRMPAPVQAPAPAKSGAAVTTAPTQRVAREPAKPKPKAMPTLAPAAPPGVATTTPAPTAAAATKVMPAATPAPLPQPALVAPPSAATPTASAGVPMLSELPEALRRQIPPLTISGAVYSDDPSLRMLLLNNQTFGPGNTVAPGLQLEEIQSSSSVFNFQGTRFQLSH